MRKNGFTLIELIAIIIILAILMLIVLPVMTDIIDQTEISAIERSAENYVEAVETEIARQRMNGHKIKDGTYTILSNGSISLDSNTYTIKVDGDYPTSGNITIENYKIVKDTSMFFTIGDYTASYDSTSKIVVSLTESMPMCKLVSGTAYAVGSKYICNPGDGDKTFYVLEDGDNTTLEKGTTGTAGPGEVSLIMDRNIDDETVAWCLSGNSNSCAAGEATAALAEKTSEWTSSQILSIDLPTAEQIAAVDGYDWSTYNAGNLSSWLYVNLYSSSNTSMPVGYWTSTANAISTDSAWFVLYSGHLDYNSVNDNGTSGVRPVITISKQNFIN